jgi:hypothetical protein
MSLWGRNDADANTKPKYVAVDSNPTRDGANTYVGAAALVTVYGVDAAEIGVAGVGGQVSHTGWVKVTRGSGGRAGRTFNEVLVAGSIVGDAADDALFPDA